MVRGKFCCLESSELNSSGLSTYTPAWVKMDQKRFPRAKLRKAGGVLETADVVSIFHEEALKADSKAFARLMRFLKEFDERHSTVIMVQVENECGLLGDSRDASLEANEAFTNPVPREVLDFLTKECDELLPDLRDNLTFFYSLAPEKRRGSWRTVLGKGPATDEIFMAYHYSRYINTVAAAGKAEYPLPLYHNVWMNNIDMDTSSSGPVVAGGGGAPGDYPSGGGVSNVLDIWIQFATNLEFISPDIYLNDYSKVCAKYRHRNQPLFIPEQRRDDYGARRTFGAIGSHQAIGTSPFGIDTIPNLGQANCTWRLHYGLLASVAPFVLDAQRRPDSILGFFFDDLLPDGRDPSPTTVAGTFGGFEASISRAFVFGKPGSGAGMLIHKSNSNNRARFLLVGYGFQVSFRSTRASSAFTGILSFKEKKVVEGKLETVRWLNGDETRSGKVAVMPSAAPDYGGFPIAITIPAGTMIAECEVYSLDEESED